MVLHLGHTTPVQLRHSNVKANRHSLLSGPDVKVMEPGKSHAVADLGNIRLQTNLNK